MKVTSRAENHCLTICDTLLLVCPLASELESSLNRFSTSVHWKDHIVSEHIRDLLRKSAKNRVVECARRQRQLLRLFNHRVDDFGMTMSLQRMINTGPPTISPLLSMPKVTVSSALSQGGKTRMTHASKYHGGPCRFPTLTGLGELHDFADPSV